jgi:soluble lytic murein transglycosylase
LGYLTTDKPIEFMARPSGSIAETVHSPKESADFFFRIAFDADRASFYYQSLAASYLGETIRPLGAEASVGKGRELSEETFFLLDFFAHGCADMAYAYAVSAAPDLTIAELRAIATAFGQHERWGESIRFAAHLWRRPEFSMTRSDMELLYPKPFQEIIEPAAIAWNIPKEILYGLIRTESAFIPDVVSRSGAVGLAQLMPATAKDVAARIRKLAPLKFLESGDPDLRDPQTNMTLGAWYLADLTRRLESPLLALGSYNGGITRLRRWRQNHLDLPEDLFLETIEITETREYARKVLAAAAVYGYLYYGMSMEEVVADIFPK